MEGKGKRQCIILTLHYLHIVLLLINMAFSINGMSAHEDSNIKISSNETLEMFVDELPLLSVVKGYKLDEMGNPETVELTIGMYNITWKFHRDLPLTHVFAFGTSECSASVPGPTIEAMANVKTEVRWENHLPDSHLFPIDPTLDIPHPSQGGVPTVVHLHGGADEPQSDGHPRAWFTRDFRETGEKWTNAVYEYGNPSEAGGDLWYHDHAVGITRLNILAGLFGTYKIINPSVESRFRLPSGPFEVFLAITDRNFTKDGQIYINATGIDPSVHPNWQPETFGDVIIVNGKAWPYMKVERRRYRFRIVNTSGARFFNLSLGGNQSTVSFTQVASDSFYLEQPVAGLTDITLGPSEIADVVVDFSELSNGSEILMSNSAPYPFPSGDAVNELNSRVMKFVVAASDSDNQSVTEPPSTHFVNVVRLREEDATTRRDIVLSEVTNAAGDPTSVLINFAPYGSPVTETPRHNTTELWRIINLTNDNHPIHIHVAAFQAAYLQQINDTDAVLVCAQSHGSIAGCGLEAQLAGSQREVPIESEAGWKNVFKVPPGYVVTLYVRFSLPTLAAFPFDPTGEPGYAYHCHILDHEDNSMMRPFLILP